jgi:aspartyl/asparaginyl beta-hydroxylase (cupin superfamily)
MRNRNPIFLLVLAPVFDAGAFGSRSSRPDSEMFVFHKDKGGSALSFHPKNCQRTGTTTRLASKGFGSSTGDEAGASRKPNEKKTSRTTTKHSSNRLILSLEDRPKPGAATSASPNRPFVRSEQEDLLDALAAKSSSTCVGRAVADARKELAMTGEDREIDPFWELMPSLLHSRFPNVVDSQFERVAGVVEHAILSGSGVDSQRSVRLLPQSIVDDPWRPHDEIHAYMPGLGETQPFWDPAQLSITEQLSASFSTIRDEYRALLADNTARFQSVTSMNYESGWQTLVLFYNGKRIPGFPYHLCPRTTDLLESLPLAGRIAGFNRQAPKSGIPLHSDGNNMWLTLQMGISIPEGERAWIRVGPETRRWREGECICYDTTYEHETFNEHESQERVVLHIDFFNTLRMTPIEIEAMRYIYSLREEFMKAEGVAKVGKRIL